MGQGQGLLDNATNENREAVVNNIESQSVAPLPSFFDDFAHIQQV